MNKKKSSSVKISGLGISGLITASLLCKEKIKVECFEPNNISKFGSDQRTTAFLNPAIAVFKEIGVWEKIEGFSQPLKEMEIIDAGNSKNGEIASVVFEPKEINIEYFGYNIPNNILRSELLIWLKKNINAMNEKLLEAKSELKDVKIKHEKKGQVKISILGFLNLRLLTVDLGRGHPQMAKSKSGFAVF